MQIWEFVLKYYSSKNNLLGNPSSSYSFDSDSSDNLQEAWDEEWRKYLYKRH